MSIRTKLFAGLAGVFLPLALLCSLAIVQLGATDARMSTLYRDRLAPTIGLSQLVENLDQMRQIVSQYALTTKGEESAAVLRDGVQIEIQTLDVSIAHAIALYGATTTDPEQRALLAQWPAAWQSFRAARDILLRESTGTPRQQRATVDALTTSSATASTRRSTSLTALWDTSSSMATTCTRPARTPITRQCWV